MRPIQVLLTHAIDYAGLFPPAALPLPAAVANHSSYHTGADAWALGRFVVPAARLAELAEALPARSAWKVSVLVGSELPAELGAIAAFNERQAVESGAVIDSIELKAGSVEQIEAALGRIPRSLAAYVELPIESDPNELIAAVKSRHGRAKVRTGGITADAFPSTSHLCRFITGCVEAQLPFKATAGLHHPLRAVYPYTYAHDSSRGTMFGFLNLFLATALLESGAPTRSAARLLEEVSPDALQIDDASITWEGCRLDMALLHRTRERMVSFGSCSFVEPLAELRQLGLLQPEAWPA